MPRIKQENRKLPVIVARCCNFCGSFRRFSLCLACGILFICATDLQVRFQLGWSKSLVPSQGDKTRPNRVTADRQLVHSFLKELIVKFSCGRVTRFWGTVVDTRSLDQPLCSDTVTELDNSDRRIVTEAMSDLID